MPADLPSVIRDWDPAFRILAALAAPGGLWFWIDKYRNRVQIKVRSVSLLNGDTSGRWLALRVENVGAAVTSTESTFSVSGYTIERKRFALTYRFQNEHTKLTPFDAVELSAAHNAYENNTLLWAWYFVLRVSLTRGRTLKIRCRNIEFQQLGFWQFNWERFRYVYFGKLPE
jgi:hypothetical protein